jgi:hypothetical protein
MATGGDRDSIHLARTVGMDSNTWAILDAMQKQHEKYELTTRRVQNQINDLTRMMDEQNKKRARELEV